MSGALLGHAHASEDVLVSIGVDYLTCTAVEPDGWQPLHRQASSLFRVQMDQGNEPRPWGMAGFKGFSCGSIAVGRRDQETIARLSSDSAALSWRSMVQHANNVSRIDLQVTVKTVEEVNDRLEKHRAEAEADAKKSGEKKVVRWIRDNRGGYTLYLGQRSSICFGRIYNKYEQSKIPQFERCARYEVQYHNKLARNIASSLESDHQTIPRIASYCSQFFAGRGVDLGLQCKAGATYSCSRSRSDAEKNLEWLARAVRPTVLRLIASGRGAETLKALGLVQEECVE